MPSEDRDAIATMIRRGTLKEFDARGSQHLARVTGLRGEELAGVPRFKEFGFSSHPPIGSTATIMALGGRSDRAMVVGIDHADHGPRDLETGHTSIYDAYGNTVSLVQKRIRIVSSGTVSIKAPVIILDGLVKLGGEDANKPASMLGTTDSAGHSEIGNLATRVLVK